MVSPLYSLNIQQNISPVLLDIAGNPVPTVLEPASTGPGLGFVYIQPIDGVSDDAPHIAAVLTANAYKNAVVFLPGPTGQKFQILSDFVTPSGSFILGTPGTVFVQGGTLVNATFFQNVVLSGKTYNVNVASLPGAKVINLAAAPAVGERLLITQTTQQAGNQYWVTAVAPAAGGFNVTLDRPLNYALSSVNPPTQQVATITTTPQDIVILGDGMTFTGGGGNAYIHFITAWRCLARDCNSDQSAGSFPGSSIGFCWDTASLDCIFHNIDCNSTATEGFWISGAERTVVSDCKSTNATAANFLFSDCNDCMLRNCYGYSGANVTPYGADITSVALGSRRVTIDGGSFTGNQVGVLVTAASQDIAVIGVHSAYSTSANFEVDSTVGPVSNVTFDGCTSTLSSVGFLVGPGNGTGVQFVGCVADGGAVAGTGFTGQSDASYSGCSAIGLTGAGGSGWNLHGKAPTPTNYYQLKNCTAEVAASTAIALITQSGADVRLDGFSVNLDGGTAIFFQMLSALDSLRGSDLTWTGSNANAAGSDGIFALNASQTVALGKGFGLDGLANPVVAVAGVALSLAQEEGALALADASVTLTWAQCQRRVLAMTPTAPRIVSLPVASSGQSPPGLTFIVENDSAGGGITVSVEPLGGAPAVIAPGTTAPVYVKTSGVACAAGAAAT
jgi:hypothetical protein